MNRSPHPFVVLTIAIGLVLSGVAMPGLAQQPPQPSERAQQDARRDQEMEQGARAHEIEQRRILDRQRLQAHNARKLWLEQRKRKPIIGVLLAPDEHIGANIVGVTPDSAAEKGGLRTGDRIIRIDKHRLLGSSGELRVANARKLLDKLDTETPVRIIYLRDNKEGVATVTPKLGERVVMLPNGSRMEKRVRIHRDGDPAILDGIAPDAAAQIHKEIIRLGRDRDCKGANCKTPMLLSAFRWNGLNLASLDPQLGRYFGTDKGVLVLSAGELDGLQSGDVIQSVDGRQVDSPREVMDALRDKPANARVAVGYLRDRKTGRTNVTVPEMMRDLPLPPTPPAAPRPPAPPRTPASPAPPAPPAAHMAVPPFPPTPPVFDARDVSCMMDGEQEICTLKGATAAAL